MRARERGLAPGPAQPAAPTPPRPAEARRPGGDVALEPAPAAPDTTLALAPRHDTMTRRTGEYSLGLARKRVTTTTTTI